MEHEGGVVLVDFAVGNLFEDFAHASDENNEGHSEGDDDELPLENLLILGSLPFLLLARVGSH